MAKSNAAETAQVESEQQRRIAKIGQFVAQSFTEFDLHPQRSLLLLVEGFKRETPRLVLAEQALHQVDIAMQEKCFPV